MDKSLMANRAIVGHKLRQNHFIALSPNVVETSPNNLFLSD